MACGCRGNSGSGKRTTMGAGKMLGMLQATQKMQAAPKVFANGVLNANTMPTPPARSASGENAEKRKVQKIRRDAIRRALGR